MSAYRNPASFGKRMEYTAIVELLKRGFDVYMTLVDDQQIDCVIRKDVRGKPVYIDVQIKARSNSCNARSAGTFAAMEIRKPRRNFFFIFYSEQGLGDAESGGCSRGKSQQDRTECGQVSLAVLRHGERRREAATSLRAFHLLNAYKG